MKQTLLAALCFPLAALFAAIPGQAPAQDEKVQVTYSDVASILQARCINCHAGPRAPTGLRLDSYSNTMAGSKNGPAVLPGKPDQSPIIKAVKGVTKPRMPKNGPPWLTDAQIATLEKWIASGAPQ
ncbi:MAG: hypothetical protein LLG06_14590 [Desulfobacteraceae bacterium]|nr:hypothetical protein [Desulfobacteraceae bacterium]